MNEDKKELVENEMEKVAGGRLHHRSPEKDLSDEDREKLKEFINDRNGYAMKMEALKMKEEMKVLDVKEMEKVTGGTIDWRHFPKEVKDAIEKEQQKDGGATGSW